MNAYHTIYLLMIGAATTASMARGKADPTDASFWRGAFLVAFASIYIGFVILVWKP